MFAFARIRNMLAFINTVPALLTFRVPDYNKNGLPAHEIYVGANYSNGLVKIKTVHLDSDELDLSGNGELNLNKDSIDMVFNLITGAKKSIGHIPLLGYVLSGDKKRPSITLTVKGDLHDPEISNTAFKEVATYPLQLLKRTTVLPAHLVKKVNKKTDNQEIESSTTSD